MQQFEGYILLHNISKPKNIGTIIRNASAFNFKKVFLIGKECSSQQKRKFKVAEGFSFFGSHGTQFMTDFQIFPSLKEAHNYFKENNIYICGIEICEGAANVVQHPFKGNTVFFLGNEGTGLIEEHKAICDHFVYIPQYSQKTASLNVGVASGIVFHHFARSISYQYIVWAGYPEAEKTGEKFQDQDQMSKDLYQKKHDVIEFYKNHKIKKTIEPGDGTLEQQ